MLRLLIAGLPGTPVFELGERLSEFHDLPYLVIEREPSDCDSYFDDKIPEVTLDTGDLSSGSESQTMVRDPNAMEKDKKLDEDLCIETGFKGLDSDDIFEVQKIKQGIISTEIPDRRLVLWATDCIFLDADEKNAIDWFSGRRKCISCGNVHHLEDKPSRDPEICDRCGTFLIRLDKDDPNVVRKQFKNWRNDFWRFIETAKKETDYMTYSVHKFRSFSDLCRRIDLKVRESISRDNWYLTIKKETPSIWGV